MPIRVSHTGFRLHGVARRLGLQAGASSARELPIGFLLSELSIQETFTSGGVHGGEPLNFAWISTVLF
jgi:hypothetical protein